MNSQILSSSNSLFLLFLLEILLLVQVPPSLSHPYEFYYKACGRKFSCGTITGIGYPFRGQEEPENCGYPGLVLNCKDSKITTINIMNLTYRVLDLNQITQVMKIAREDVMESTCPKDFVNTTLDYGIFDYASQYTTNFTFLYGCPDSFTFPVTLPGFNPINLPGLNNPITTCGYNGVYVVPGGLGPGICNVSVIVPVLKDLGLGGSTKFTGLDEFFREGFEVRWKVDNKVCSACTGSNGHCGYDIPSKQSICYCSDPPYLSGKCSMATRTSSTLESTQTPGSGSSTSLLKLIIGIAGGSCGIMLMCLIICYTRLKTTSYRSIIFWKKKNDNRTLEAFIRNNGSLAPKRYSYSDLKKMTSSFRYKLGQGGYGCVYKGKLADDCLVAVKILDASKGNGEEFINEVASISRTSHVNVVTLLGFCLEGRKRALIYDFMPNGSLEKFIYGEGLSKTNGHLGWEKLYQISIGIAQGLEYLHRGCRQRILHFDIKPHNILLDEDFCPKISDFGLAKLCTNKESFISMSEARGTIGYIAPEVISRNFGEVSHKSDVYSYGMMTLEMVGGRKNADFGTSNTSKIYFPHWVYKRLELNEELGFQGDMTKEENEMARKMILVGLWCIQTYPSQRPSITKVVEMLEGIIEAIEIPPGPYLYSSSRSVADSSTT